MCVIIIKIPCPCVVGDIADRIELKVISKKFQQEENGKGKGKGKGNDERFMVLNGCA